MKRFSIKISRVSSGIASLCLIIVTSPIGSVANQPTLADLLEQNEAAAPAATVRPAVDTVDSRASTSAGPKDAQVDTRLPVPTPDATRSALATVRTVFEAELNGAKTVAQLEGLSDTLMTEAGKVSKPVEQWALLRQSLELAVASGNLEICDRILARLAEIFKVDAAAARFDVLTQLATKPRPDFADRITIACLEDARRLAADGDFVTAKKLLSVGQGIARKSRNMAALAQFKDAYAEMRVRENAEEEFKGLAAKYEANPGDRQAALGLGRHYCFIDGDWDRGLPLLAKGSDAELVKLATADLSRRDSSASAVSAADGWLEWAKKQKGLGHDAAAARAIDLYSEVRAKLDGLERTLIEKRIQEAGALGLPSGAKVWVADLVHQSISGLAVGLTTDGTYQGKPFTCAGQPCSKSLLAMPGPAKPAIIGYAIPPGVRRVSGTAGVFVPEAFRHMPNLKPAAPQNFEIRLDGRTVWKSRPLHNCNDMMEFDVVVAGGTRLEFVTTTDNPNSAFAAWIDPYFAK